MGMLYINELFVMQLHYDMVFGGGILGGARKIWGNPYLNSTTVLFDYATNYLSNVFFL